MSGVLKILEERGFVEAKTDENLGTYLDENKVTVYAGFDPTASSLHVGHLLPVMGLAHLQRAGHRVIMLVGGATGMVGDPSGRSDERNLLTPDKVEENVKSVREQLACFLDFDGDNPAALMNNHDWIGKMSFIDWLREVGKYFNVNQMLQKESVKSRLGNESGISYTEFSYMTMQAYDFCHLCREEDCTLQVGGSDQWGNITAGIDLTRKTLGRKVYGLTFPLITTSSGEKFGKSAGNAVWLDPELTSPYEFFQYWINVDDDDVERLLKYFTFLPVDEINEIVTAHNEAPQRRDGQRRLAAEMTKLVHGEDGLAAAEKATAVLFGGDVDGMTDRDFMAIAADMPSTEIARSELDDGIGLLNLFTRTGLCSSNGQARRDVKQGACNLNNQKVSDESLTITSEHLASESCILLRRGKRNYHLIRFV